MCVYLKIITSFHPFSGGVFRIGQHLTVMVKHITKTGEKRARTVQLSVNSTEISKKVVSYLYLYVKTLLSFIFFFQLDFAVALASSLNFYYKPDTFAILSCILL